MKQLSTFILLLLTSFSLSAQLEKGTILLGGMAGINNISSDGDGITVVTIAPSAGFFLNNRVAIGAALDLGFAFSDGSNSSSLGVSPFGRVYFNTSGNNRFFGQAELGIQSSKSGDSDANNIFNFGVGVGADFFLNDHVAIEGFLGYSRLNYLEDSPFDLSLNQIGLNFGVAAFISRNKSE